MPDRRSSSLYSFRRKVAVPDEPARPGRDLGCEILQREGPIPGQLVDSVLASSACEDGHGGIGVVSPCRRCDASVPGGAVEHTALESPGEILGVVLDVPTIAQEHEWNPGRADLGLRRLVLHRDRRAARVGVQDTGVGEESHARPLRRADHVSVVREKFADLAARDEEQPIDPRQRPLEGLGHRVVRPADVNTAAARSLTL